MKSEPKKVVLDHFSINGYLNYASPLKGRIDTYFSIWHFLFFSLFATVLTIFLSYKNNFTPNTYYLIQSKIIYILQIIE